MTRPDQSERNERILARRDQGDTLAAIGRDFELGKERIRQIVLIGRREPWRPQPRPDRTPHTAEGGPPL